MKIEKNKLKVGDLILFHNWGIGGFLFGVIVECEDGYNIWRSKSNFSLDNVDGIELIEKVEDVKDYALHDFHDFINDINEHGIYCNFENKI